MESDKEKHLYTAFIEVHNSNPLHVGEDCYLTGNFNNWAIPGYKLGAIPPLGHSLQATIEQLPSGYLEAKLTRGDWHSCLANDNGRIADVVSVELVKEHHICIELKHWRDEFPQSTASSQVHVLNESFYLPHLNTKRRLWIYLPSRYKTHTERYPVIYMHDGQHLFDEALSVGRAGPVEWQVDETIDNSIFKTIVIGIAHADTYEERLDEYLIEPFGNLSGPRGRLYLRDIVEVIKPYVDLHYRTLSDVRHTAIVGSSVGGLISLYGGLSYPDVFGTIGAFSPSLWMGHDLLGLYANSSKEMRASIAAQAYYFYAGEQEIREDRQLGKINLEADMQEFISSFRHQQIADLEVDIDPRGHHGALYWQRAFKRFYDWWQTHLKF